MQDLCFDCWCLVKSKNRRGKASCQTNKNWTHMFPIVLFSLHPSPAFSPIRWNFLRSNSNQRNYYASKVAFAKSNPSQATSIAIDGMDQSKTSLIHLKSFPTGFQKRERLKVHVTGVKAHGLGNYAFIDHCQFPHDANLVVNALMKTIEDLDEKGLLGADLFIQVDNTVRENKNCFLIGYLADLVDREIFRKVFSSSQIPSPHSTYLFSHCRSN